MTVSAAPPTPVYPLPRPAVVGVIHLAALPGSPRANQSVDAIIARGVEEAARLEAAGFDALIIENFGDAPFHRDRVEPIVVAAMTRIVTAVRGRVSLPVGCNVLRNDATAALSIAAAAGAAFIRVNVHSGVYATDQGIIEGTAAETLRLRRLLGADVAVFADVHVKHAAPISEPNLARAAEDTAQRGLADALIVTGKATAAPASLDDVRTVRSAAPSVPVLVGSGVSAETLADALAESDGVIVGSALREEGVAGAPLDAARLGAFVKARRSILGA